MIVLLHIFLNKWLADTCIANFTSFSQESNSYIAKTLSWMYMHNDIGINTNHCMTQTMYTIIGTPNNLYFDMAFLYSQHMLKLMQHRASSYHSWLRTWQIMQSVPSYMYIHVLFLCDEPIPLIAWLKRVDTCTCIIHVQCMWIHNTYT